IVGGVVPIRAGHGGHSRRGTLDEAALRCLVQVITGIHAVAVEVVERDLRLSQAAAVRNGPRAAAAILKVDVRDADVGRVVGGERIGIATAVLEARTIGGRTLAASVSAYGCPAHSRADGIAAA